MNIMCTVRGCYYNVGLVAKVQVLSRDKVMVLYAMNGTLSSGTRGYSIYNYGDVREAFKRSRQVIKERTHWLKAITGQNRAILAHL